MTDVALDDDGCCFGDAIDGGHVMSGDVKRHDRGVDSRRFCVPYTVRLASTTPPALRGSIEHVPMGCDSVVLVIVV